MTAGTVTDSHRYSAMAPARLGLRLCALRKPRHAVIPGLRNNVATSSHVLRFNRISGFGEGQRSVITAACLGTNPADEPITSGLPSLARNR
jgi:hypothetical protein